MKTAITALLGILLSVCCCLSQTNTVTLTPSSDTMIYSDQLNSEPEGNGSAVFSGTSGQLSTNEAFLKFDFSAIPTNAIVTNGALTLQSTESAPVTNWVGIFFVLMSWDGATTTWTTRLGTNLWSVAGASSGVDYRSFASQSNLTGRATTVGYTWPSSPTMVEDIQYWVLHPSENNGWLVKSMTNATQTVRKWASSENSTVSKRPKLVVQYYVPTTPVQPTLTITLDSVDPSQVTLGFNTEAGRAYEVQYTGELPATNWLVLTNFSSTVGTNVTILDSVTTNIARFYQVRVQ